MRVLVIHHLEPMWESGYRGFGKSFEGLCLEVAEHLELKDYDRIILTRFESSHMNEFEYYPLENFSIEVNEYGYGWELDGFLDEDETERINIINEKLDDGEIYETAWGKKLARGGSHSQVVIIEDWMERLKGCDVSICGAFDGECIEDLEVALDSIGVEYKRIEELII